MNIITKLIANSIVRAFLFIMRLRTKKYPKALQDAQRAKFKSLIDKHNKGE